MKTCLRKVFFTFFNGCFFHSYFLDKFFFFRFSFLFIILHPIHLPLRPSSPCQTPKNYNNKKEEFFFLNLKPLIQKINKTQKTSTLFLLIFRCLAFLSSNILECFKILFSILFKFLKLYFKDFFVGFHLHKHGVICNPVELSSTSFRLWPIDFFIFKRSLTVHFSFSHFNFFFHLKYIHCLFSPQILPRIQSPQHHDSNFTFLFVLRILSFRISLKICLPITSLLFRLHPSSSFCLHVCLLVSIAFTGSIFKFPAYLLPFLYFFVLF